MIHASINVNAPGPLGLHNRYKQKLRQEDEALFEYMKNATSLTSWTLVEVKKESYRYWSPEEGRFVYSGVVVLKIQKDIMYPATLHVPVELIDVITTITLKGVGYNYLIMVANMQDAQSRIHLEHGPDLCSDRFLMMHFWRSLDLDAGVHNFTFKTEAVQKRIGYFQERPGHTKDQIIHDLASVFINLQDSGEWEASYGKIAQRKNPIVALSTKVEKTSKDSKALSNKVEKIVAGEIAIKDAAADTKPDVEPWRKFKTKQYVISPDDGKKYEWCNGPHGTYRGGMYMKAPHDHREWWASKPFNRVNDAKRGGAAAPTAVAGTYVKKGAIDKNTQQAAYTTVKVSAFTTKMQGFGFGDKEIGDILEESKE
jgi:hypothetical protein